MKFTKGKLLGTGIVIAAAICALAPQKAYAAAPELEMDGVMGQSVKEEMEQKPDLDTLLMQQKGWIGASSYTKAFKNASFTSYSDYTNKTYYHKDDYKDYQIFNGIDVSWYQGGGKGSKKSNIDWKKAHADGIDYVFVRAASRDTADGSIYEDTSANAHIEGAAANDINIGLYMFSQALTEKEAVQEANYILKLIDKYDWDVTMPIAMDREPGANKRLTAGKLSKAKETAVCQAFTDTIADAGYDVLIYSNYHWFQKYIDWKALDGCDLWFARYNITTTSNTKKNTPYADVPSDYAFWQYASSGNVNGYAGRLDCNFWYKDTSAAPSDLHIDDSEENSIKLSWGAADDADGYKIYRYDPEQDRYVYLEKTEELSYEDTDLQSGTEYQYKVRGYWVIGGTYYYGGYSGDVESVTTLAKVNGISVKKTTNNSIRLSWNKVTGADGYLIYQYDEASGKYVKVYETNKQSGEIKNLSGAKEYFYKIRAYKTVNEENYYGKYSSKTACMTNPDKVTNLKGSTKAAAVTLKWDKVTGAGGYQIYRYNAETGKYELTATVNSGKKVSYKNTKLKKGKKYSYKVRAYKKYAGKTYYGSFSAAFKIKAK